MGSYDTRTYLEETALLTFDAGAQQKREVLPVHRQLEVGERGEEIMCGVGEAGPGPRRAAGL
jgi:hypothetical protein